MTIFWVGDFKDGDSDPSGEQTLFHVWGVESDTDSTSRSMRLSTGGSSDRVFLKFYQ